MHTLHNCKVHVSTRHHSTNEPWQDLLSLCLSLIPSHKVKHLTCNSSWLSSLTFKIQSFADRRRPIIRPYSRALNPSKRNTCDGSCRSSSRPPVIFFTNLKRGCWLNVCAVYRDRWSNVSVYTVTMWSTAKSLSHSSAIPNLCLLFVTWKILLLVIAALSPGPGYDTSTQLLLAADTKADPTYVRSATHLLTRLVRWDALYFINISNRGYQFEQEWAFGWGFTTLIRYVAKGARNRFSSVPKQGLSEFQCFLPRLLSALLCFCVRHLSES